MKKRVLSFILALTMVVGILPDFSAVALAAPEDETIKFGIVEKEADPSTLDSWKNYFGTDSGSAASTAHAGEIWTDKTVLADGTAALGNVEGLNTVTLDEDHFLVALSAMGSNKTIQGYETMPTDTMFILDLSSSMHSGTSYKTEAIVNMLDAVNNSIKQLQELNPHNRVGVTIYFGGPHRDNNGSRRIKNDDYPATYVMLLELDRYTANNDTFLFHEESKKANIGEKTLPENIELVKSEKHFQIYQ